MGARNKSGLGVTSPCSFSCGGLTDQQSTTLSVCQRPLIAATAFDGGKSCHRCEECRKTFERTETISEHEAAKPQCPKCGSKNVSAVPSRVYVVTSKKS
jgi:putative FmdB family regulatory protein